jgi:hypothetical protein
MQQSIDDKSGGIHDRSAAGRIAGAGALGQMPIRAGRIDERLPSTATRHRNNSISLICQFLGHYSYPIALAHNAARAMMWISSSTARSCKAVPGERWLWGAPLAGPLGE